MSVTFQAKDHSYKSINPDENIDWLSVTSFVSQFKQKFDPVAQAIKSSKNSKSKWYGMSVEDIQNAWNSEGKRATDLGTWYHDQREKDLSAHQTIQRSGVEIPIIKPIYDGALKLAPDQKLTEGIYPEHFVYLKSAGICGQSDRVEVVKSTVDIIDYKTNKEIKMQSFKNWEGISQKMTGPCAHLDDCNYYHYALQLSVYLYMILKHNPQYRPGKLILHHITFEEEGQDKYGYPIAKKDHEGNPIMKAVIPYEVPYLKTEVIAMINWLHENRARIKDEKEKSKG
jgi:hypothetical protein